MSSAKNLDSEFFKWRELHGRQSKSKGRAKALAVATGLGWLLFLYKIGQTTEMALRYSRDARESIGTWIMILIAMTIGTIVLMSSAARTKKQAEVLASSLRSDFRTEITSADEGLRSKLESQLRELGA